MCFLLPKVIIIFFNVYLFLSERDTHTEYKLGRVRERERETRNPKQVPGSEL